MNNIFDKINSNSLVIDAIDKIKQSYPNLTVGKFISMIFTESITSNYSIDELFTFLISITIILSTFFKYFHLIEDIFNISLSNEQKNNLYEYNVNIMFIQSLITIIYIFYTIKMILNEKSYMIINRNTLLINYVITTITILYFIYNKL
jgi:hypothetical protein